MGKTYKRYPMGYFRRPRGRKQALINHCRPGAIPPDAWDDIRACNLAWRPMEIARRLNDEGWKEEDIRKTLKNKFKLRPYEIREILTWM